MLSIENISLEINNKKILENISFNIEKGDWLMLIGPNGAGKSSLIKAIMNTFKHDGDVFINNKNIKTMKTVDIAKNIAVLTQTQNTYFDFTVEEIVELGLYAHKKSPFAKLENIQIVYEAMDFVGVLEFKNRRISSLSGGEIQRVYLSQLIAQNPKVLILDEPANHLDLSNVIQLYELLQLWLSKGDRAIISVVHDLSFAKLYGNKALLLNKGKQIDMGTINQVLNDENINKVYGINIKEYIQKLSNTWH